MGFKGWPSIAELLEVLVVCAGQEVEEGIEAAVERASQLGNRAVECMQGQARRRTVGERHLRVFEPLQRAFRDQSNAVNEGVAGHGDYSSARCGGAKCEVRVRSARCEVRAGRSEGRRALF